MLFIFCVRLSVEAAAIEEELVIKSVSGMDCVLQCTAVYKDGVQYGAVRWYKVQESLSPGLSGLVTRNLSSGETKYYVGLDRELQLLAGSRNIFMPNVTCDDAGVYECHLAAPVGEQNREGRVLLTVTDCPVSLKENLMTDTFAVICATAVLMLALVIFLISYRSLKNVLRDRKSMSSGSSPRKLDERDMMIYTSGKPVYV
uniref:CD83 molecule n=1 Tax=Scophthalmus maximus TaxID=52904 RepID=A0A8D3B650_SCOMX